VTRSKMKPVCIGWDVSIVLAFACLAVVVWWRGITYISGVTNRAIDKDLPFGPLLLYAIVGLLLLSCIAVMVMGLLHQWKIIPVWGNAVRCVIILLMCASFIAAFTYGAAGVDRFAQGFEQRMRGMADVEAIRTWSSGLAVPPASDSVPSVPDNRWPECVTALAPQQVYYLTGIKGVKLDWGGGFIGHYGLVVGAEEMVLPHTTMSDLIIPLEAGAYLYFPNR